MDIIVGVIVVTVIWLIWKKPAEIGGFLYHLNVAIESMLYGFSSKRVHITYAQVHMLSTRFDPKKQTILMLHGFTADNFVWLRFARNFTSKYNVIIPDLLGHGNSDYNADWSYNAKSQADMVVKLLDELKVEKVHVIGNSMGGFITAQLALDYPQRVFSACYVDPAGIKPVTQSALESLLCDGCNPFLILERADFARLYPMTMHRSPWLPEIAKSYIAERYVKRKTRYKHIFKEFFGKGLLDTRLSGIKTPSLILWGAKDQLIHVDNAYKWQSLIPNAKLKVWDDIGHMPMLEIPRVSAEVYKDFLNSL